MDNRDWFKKAGYGMMVHWGLYSLLAGEYKGLKSGHYAEWIQSYHKIPIKEYENCARHSIRYSLMLTNGSASQKNAV